MPRNDRAGLTRRACTRSCRDGRAGQEGAALSSRQAAVKGAESLRLMIRRHSSGSTEKAAAAAPWTIATLRTAVTLWDSRNNSRSTQLGARGMVGVERGR